MKLRTAQVREFKSIWDSNPFTIDRVACLVGKNEAGKTSILQALYRLNPIIPADGNFDVTYDYPKSEVENYQQDIENKRKPHAKVITATFELETHELEAVNREYGVGALAHREIEVTKGYAKDAANNCTWWVVVPVDLSAIVKHLVNSFDLPAGIKTPALQNATIAGLSAFLAESGKRADQAVANAQAEANSLADEAEKAAALENSKTLAESE